MRHTVLNTIDAHPYEIVEVQLDPESPQERKSIDEIDEDVENYLTLTLNAVEVLQTSPPAFTIKCVKQRLGFGE